MKRFPPCVPSNLRVFTSCLLSFLILMSPIASVSAASMSTRANVQPEEAKTSYSITTVEPPSASPALFGMFAPAVGPITATKSDAFADADGDGKAELGETITYTVGITNTGTDPALGVTFNDTIDANTTFVPNSMNVSPLAFDDAYTAVGNTLLEVGNATTQTGPQKSVTGSVISNDVEFLGDSFTISAFDATGTSGGTVTMVTTGPDAGSFTYISPANFTGTDTFTYTIRDDGTDSIAGNADDLTGIGTVTITVANQVWYVDNNAGPGGDGRSTTPFDALADVSGATGPDTDGDIIYVNTGVSNYIGGITLLNNQTLHGEGTALVVGADTLATAGTDPTITNAAGSGVTLANGNTLTGFTVGNTTVADVTDGGATVGTLTITNVVLNGTGAAVDIDQGGTLAATFDSISSSGAATAIDLGSTTGVAGNFTVSGATTIDDATADGIVISNSSVTATFTGVVTILNDGANGDGVDLLTNSGTYNFNGGVNITVIGAGAFGFRAQSSGTVNILNPNSTNQITSNNGTGLLINPTTLNATLNTLTSGGGTEGISLNGMSGSLTIGSVSINGQTVDGIDITNSAGSVTINGGSIGNINDPAGIGVDINGGAGNVTITSTINKTTAGDVVEISGRTGGTVGFNGNLTSNAAAGVDLTSNTSGTIRFDGGMTLSTGATIAFNSTASAGTTLIVTDPGGPGSGNNNTLTTTTGIALNVANTSIGTEHLNFQSISANGASSGIVLNTTGTTASFGGLNVTGDTGTSNNGSGGVIQNSTGAGISLTNTRDVSLDQMNVTGGGDDGIHGVGVVNFTLNRSNVNSNGNSTADDGLQFGETSGSVVGVTGNVSILASSISTNAHNNVHIRNTSGNIANLTVTNSTFNDLNDTFGANSFLFEGSGTSTTTEAFITGSTFSNNTPQRALEVQSHDTATVSDFVVRDNKFANNGIHASFTQDTSSNLEFYCVNNGGLTAGSAITGTILQVINIFSSSTSTGGTIVGTVSGNNINTGAVNAPGVSAVIQGRTVATLLVDGNTISNTSGARGISLAFRGPTTNVGPASVNDVTVTNNNVNNGPPAIFPASAISIEADNQSGAFAAAPTVRADMRVNTVPGTSCFDATSGCLQFYEYDGDGTPGEFQDGIGQLVDTAPPSANADAQLSSTNTGSVGSVGIALIAGPINTPPPVPTPLFARLGGVEATLSSLHRSLNNLGQGLLSQAELNLLIAAAIERWAATGLSDTQIVAMRTLKFEVVDLAGDYLAKVEGDRITIDKDAGGYGWFIDPTPMDDVEFLDGLFGSRRYTNPISDPAGHIDLLTTIEHEIGHRLGLHDSYAERDRDNIMYGHLTVGERRLPARGQASGAKAGTLKGSHFLSLSRRAKPLPALTKNSATTTPVMAPMPPLTPLNIGTLPGLKSVTIKFKVTVNTTGLGSATSVSNQGTVSGNNFSSVQTDDSPGTAAPNEPTITPISRLDLELTKTDGVTSTTPGSDLTYTLTYTNLDHAANGVVLTETVPVGTTFKAAGSSVWTGCADGAPAGTVCTINLGNLPRNTVAGFTGTRTFVVTVLSPAPAGVNDIVNTASIAHDGTYEPDINTANNTATDTDSLTAAPDLNISKTDGVASTTPGSTLTYTITYSNAGNQNATGVVLTETVPVGTTFTTAGSSAWTGCANGAPAGTVCTIAVGNLNAGVAASTATFAVVVTNPADAGLANIVNTASIADDAANGADPTLPNTATDTDTLNANSDLAVTKVADVANASPGSIITYTLTYSNIGNQGATNVVITDTVPTHTTFNGGGGWTCLPNNNASSVCTNPIGTVAGGGAGGAITFAVTVVTPLPGGATQVSNTATISDDDGNGVDPPGNDSSNAITPLCANPATVTNSLDNGAGSLRQAIADVCDGGTINFQAGVTTVNLTTAQLLIDKDVTINGPGANLLTVHRQSGTFRIFRVAPGRTVTINGITVADGIASGAFPANAGGGIHNDHSVLTLTNVTISGNNATFGGGVYNNGITSGSASLTIINSTISGNTSTSVGSGGAGIYNDGSAGGSATLNITNTTISANLSDVNGGGLATDGTAAVTITNSTITNNRSAVVNAVGAGGGLSITGGSLVTLRNSIVALNFKGGSPSTTPDDVEGPLVAGGSSTHNLVGSCSSCGLLDGTDNNELGVTAAELRLGALASNGGPTQTHALLPGSIALDTGNNTYVVAPPFLNTSPITDQRGTGFSRILDAADADVTDTVDIGAYEANPMIQDIADQVTNEDVSITCLPFNIGDADEGFTSIVGTSSDQGVVPDTNIIVNAGTGPSDRCLAITLPANQSGTTTITVTVTGNNGRTVSDTFLLQVNSQNDNPTTTGIPDVAVNEEAANSTITLPTFFADVEDGSAALIYTIQSNTNPGLFTSATIGAGNVLTLDYAPNSDGTANITIRATDSGGLFVEDTFTVTVNGINDAPTLDALGNATIAEDAGTQIVNLSGITAGPGESQTLTVTAISNNTGIIPNPTVTYTSPNNTGSISYAPVADANGGPVTITVTVQDNGGTAGGGVDTFQRQFTVTVNAVNDAPNFQIPSNPPSVNEDAPAQTVNSFATNFQPGPATATDEAGQTLVGYTVTQTGTTGNLTFTSGPSINNAGQLTYTPTSNTSGTATFNVVATDSGSGTAPNVNQSAPVAFTITVNGENDAPVLDNSGNMSLNAINEDVPNASNPGTLVSDIIASAGGDRITDVDAGALEGIAVNAVDTTNGTWQFSIDNGTNWTSFGTPDALNARLLAANATTRVRFIPGPHFNGTIDPGLTFRAWDQTSGTNGNLADASIFGGTTAFSTATETASITVNPVNDGPTANAQAEATNEDTALGITLTGSDVETPSGSLIFTVTVQPTNGVLTGTGANRTYTPNPNYNGPDSFQFTVTDTGDGSSPALTSTAATVSITVNAVNDAPVNTVPGAQSMNENTTLTFSAPNSNLVSIADLDTGAAAVRVTLTAANGTITLNGTTGLSFTVGDGAADATMTFTGTITAINTALNGMTFTSAPNFDGAASLQIVTNDQGNTGSGPAGGLTDTDTVNITVIDGGTLAFSSTTYTVAEDGVNATITVNRTGGSSGEARVDYTTSNGTATAGQDYTTASGTLIFANGVTTQTFNVPITNDVLDEANETVNLTLSNATGTGGLGTPATAVLTINDNDPPPSLSIDDVSVTEGNSGTTNAVFTVTLSAQSGQPVTVNYSTANGSATAGSDYQAIPNTLLTFNPGETTQTITVVVNGDVDAEADENFFVNLSGATNATIADNQGMGTIVSDDTPVIRLSASTYSVNEGDGRATITVNRVGDLSQPARVDYATSDTSGLNLCSQITGNASERCDYATVVGTLRFAAGETSKTILIPIVDDVYLDGPEVFTLTLRNVVGGDMGSPDTATITIIDNDTAPAPNPIDNDAFFIRQLYIDFLGREPEPAGLAGWLAILNQCAIPTDCDRIAVAQGFVRSPEFQDRGYFIYLHYSAVLGRIPLYAEFIPDMASVSGFLSASDLEANKEAYTLALMNRPEFLAIYGPTLNDPTAYVDKLLQTAVLPNHPGRAGWIAGLTNQTLTNAQVLRQFIDSTEVFTKYVNEAFIIMNYFGFLRRSADAAYLTWIQIFNNTNDDRLIINGFVNSPEYRLRFGP